MTLNLLDLHFRAVVVADHVLLEPNAGAAISCRRYVHSSILDSELPI